MGYFLKDIPNPYTDANGDPCESYTLEGYEPGGATTPKELFADSSGTSAGTSVTLDTIGYLSTSGTRHGIWLDDSQTYYLRLRDASSNVIWFEDNVGVIPTDVYNRYVADTGSADAYSMTLSPAITAYTVGAEYRFLAANANTGASTLNINSVGAQSIVKYGSEALKANDIQAGDMVSVQWDGSDFQLVSNFRNLDVNGTEIILDADGDTSITADTDDQIDFRVGGGDRLVITATSTTSNTDVVISNGTPVLSFMDTGTTTERIQFQNSGGTTVSQFRYNLSTSLFEFLIGSTTELTLSATALTLEGVNLDMNGNQAILDADGDTSITADTDDQMDFKFGGNDGLLMRNWSSADTDIDGVVPGTSNSGNLIAGRGSSHFVFGLQENDATDSFSFISGGGNYTTDSTYDTLICQFLADGSIFFNGNELILDADSDTSITADTDDQIDIKIGNTDIAQLTNASGVLTITNPSTNDGFNFVPSGSGTLAYKGVEVLTQDDFPDIITANSVRSFASGDLNNTVNNTLSSNTLTMDTGLGVTGDIITLFNSAALSMTIAQGTSVTLTWMQGGASSTGNRTIAVDSVVTLQQVSTDSWYIWGNGIS